MNVNQSGAQLDLCSSAGTGVALKGTWNSMSNFSNTFFNIVNLSNGYFSTSVAMFVIKRGKVLHRKAIGIPCYLSAETFLNLLLILSSIFQ